MFFEFVQTEQGWRVYWGGIDPRIEEKTVEVRPLARAEKAVEAPVLIESDALSVMAV